jgi:hypothetical protein
MARDQKRNESPLAPTLLEIIADLNSSYKISSEGSLADPVGDAKRHGATKLLPGLDLGKIIINRLKEGSDNVIKLDLHEKIAEWDRNGRKAKPFDLQLQSGDQILFSAKPGEWAGQSETTQAYLKKALTLQIYVQYGAEAPQIKPITYHSPNWLKTAFGLIAYIEKPRLQLRARHKIESVRRDGINYKISSLRDFWPRIGDFVTTKSPPRMIRGQR